MSEIPWIFLGVVVLFFWLTYRFVSGVGNWQRNSLGLRRVLDIVGILAVLPTLFLIFWLIMPDSSGQGSGLAWFMILSVASAGIVPFISICVTVLSSRLAVRVWKRQFFA